MVVVLGLCLPGTTRAAERSAVSAPEPSAGPQSPVPPPGSEPDPETPQSPEQATQPETPEPSPVPAPSTSPPPASDLTQVDPLDTTDEPADGDDPQLDDREDLFGDDADDEPWPDEDSDVDAPGEALPDYDPRRDSPEAVRARHWIRTGIATMSAGGALLIGAIAMGASDPCNLAIGNSCQPDARNRASLSMGIPAAVLIAGGAAALGVGLQRRGRITVDAQASRTSVGLGLRGRF